MTEVKKPEVLQAIDERSAWERPELKRLEAGAAETAPTNTIDNAVLS